MTHNHYVAAAVDWDYNNEPQAASQAELGRAQGERNCARNGSSSRSKVAAMGICSYNPEGVYAN